MQYGCGLPDVGVNTWVFEAGLNLQRSLSQLLVSREHMVYYYLFI